MRGVRRRQHVIAESYRSIFPLASAPAPLRQSPLRISLRQDGDLDLDDAAGSIGRTTRNVNVDRRRVGA